MTAQIIFLHGPSSSGKSTLARAIQARIELPFWHVSFDALRETGVLPMARFASGDFSWRAARAGVFAGFHASLGAYAAAGNNLILEHILDTEGWAEELRTLFTPYDVLFVGLHCPLAVLEARETARGDRPEGSARADFENVHGGRCYDIEVQSDDGVEANAARVLAAWRSGHRVSEFAP
ncbi:MAG: AAA family ATPase [Pseudomonadota bacterium]